MPVQYQKEPEKTTLSVDEETTKNSGTRTTKKKEKEPFRFTVGNTIALVVGCLIFAGTGHYLRNSTLFLEKRTVDHYLPVEDYILYDQDTNQPTQNVRSLSIRDEHIYTGRSTYLMTSKGIQPGDSWESFVEQYGDYYAESIYVHKTDENGRVNYDADSLYISDPILIKDFDSQYVKTGQADPSENEISVYFRLDTDGLKLYYTDAERDRLYDEYSNHPARYLFQGYPDLNEFNLSFVFSPNPTDSKTNPVPGIDYISMYYYR